MALNNPSIFVPLRGSRAFHPSIVPTSTHSYSRSYALIRSVWCLQQYDTNYIVIIMHEITSTRSIRFSLYFFITVWARCDFNDEYKHRALGLFIEMDLLPSRVYMLIPPMVGTHPSGSVEFSDYNVSLVPWVRSPDPPQEEGSVRDTITKYQSGAIRSFTGNAYGGHA